MDELLLSRMIKQCKHLKFKFDGIFASDNFRRLGHKNSFQIINEKPSDHPGTHWVLLAKKNGKIIFADPLGYSITDYRQIFARCSKFYTNINVFSYAIQPMYTNDCGLYCIYIAHVIFSKQYPKNVYISTHGLTQFVTHFI
jgi:hypothetical protein